MCRSIAEGGQRCAAHTRPAALAALKTLNASAYGRVSDTSMFALATYASTPTGIKELQQAKEAFAAVGDLPRELALEAALKEGRNMRDASSETRRQVLERVNKATELDAKWLKEQHSANPSIPKQSIDNKYTMFQDAAKWEIEQDLGIRAGDLEHGEHHEYMSMVHAYTRLKTLQWLDSGASPEVASPATLEDSWGEPTGDLLEAYDGLEEQ